MKTIRRVLWIQSGLLLLVAAAVAVLLCHTLHTQEAVAHFCRYLAGG